MFCTHRKFHFNSFNGTKTILLRDTFFGVISSELSHMTTFIRITHSNGEYLKIKRVSWEMNEENVYSIKDMQHTGCFSSNSQVRLVQNRVGVLPKPHCLFCVIHVRCVLHDNSGCCVLLKMIQSSVGRLQMFCALLMHTTRLILFTIKGSERARHNIERVFNRNSYY